MRQDILKSQVIQQDMENIFHRDLPVEDLFSRTILITGATGMLASYLVYYLIWLNEVQDAKIRIIALVRSKDKGNRRFGQYASASYFVMRTDNICSSLAINEPIDYIIHAASLASPQYYGPNPVEVSGPNVLGTYYLLQLARQKAVRGFLFFSTGDVYGKMPQDAGNFSEDQIGIMDPLNEHSCYGESKRMGENWCASFAREYHVPTRSVRITHTYAPTMDVDHDPRVFASFMKCLMNQQDIVMLSDGTAKRPFCYIADAVAAFLLILLKGENGQAYNMSNEDEFLSIGKLADTLVTLDSQTNLKVVRKQRPNDDVYMENKANRGNCPSSAKLRSLGWTCEYDVRHGFSQVLRYLKEKEY